jgi:hypothetical protein
MLIESPVLASDVEWEFDGRFCSYEALWRGKTRICTAHLHEGRVFECWCSSLENAKEGTGLCAHRCEDATEVELDKYE